MCKVFDMMNVKLRCRLTWIWVANTHCNINCTTSYHSFASNYTYNDSKTKCGAFWLTYTRGI